MTYRERRKWLCRMRRDLGLDSRWSSLDFGDGYVFVFLVDRRKDGLILRTLGKAIAPHGDYARTLEALRKAVLSVDVLCS